MAGKTAVLSLSASRLSAVPPVVFSLTLLRKLDLSHNELSTASLGCAWPSLPNLRSLDLSHNRFRQVPPELGALTALLTV